VLGGRAATIAIKDASPDGFPQSTPPLLVETMTLELPDQLPPPPTGIAARWP
jgi:hypothetical protein